METELIQLSVWEQLTQEAMKYISKTPTVALIIFATWFLSRIAVRIAVGAGRIAKTDPAVVLLITSSIRFVAWIFGFTAIFNALGLTQIALTLGGTVALVAMSLATGLNTIPQDLLAGIFLITDEDFTVGRVIKTAGLEGTLKQVSIRKTKIVDNEGHLHVIPNRTIDGATYTIYPPADARAENSGGAEESSAS